ncbi:hypothetical protein [Demequina mangrovi]|uniref:Uncharacterized protein n=1 Tax=Demequina mangrovi TaxID=1043493 RepID=A0A1H6ZNM5_9MICO|nr:hypothetical protein [Demequina mangrovi]SEJ50415.1 hypothetical protein SAMN05421637_2048 [Demequina mangrovi]
MTDDLRNALLGSLDEEARRYAADHPEPDARAYEREIAPRRRARRAVEATGLLAVVAVLAVTVTLIAHPRAAVDQAPPAATSTAALLEREWLVSEAVVDPEGRAASLAESWGGAIAELRGCAALDTYATLSGRSDLGGESVALGAVSKRRNGGSEAAGVDEVHARAFAGAEEATSYLEEAVADAQLCADAAAAQGIAVTVADVGIGATEGTGVRIDVAFAEVDAPVWSLWLYVQGPEALAVVVEPGADSLAPDIIVAWFTAGAG